MAQQQFFVHNVYFWLKKDLSDAQLATFKKGVHALSTIETVKHGFVGVPSSTDRPIIDRSYDCSLVFVFNDKAGHDIYQDHPIHDDFRDTCGSFWEKVVIYDCVNE